MNFLSRVGSGVPSCTKAVIIRAVGHVVKLRQNRDILIDDQEVNLLPFWLDGIYIKMSSSIFLIGKLKGREN